MNYCTIAFLMNIDFHFGKCDIITLNWKKTKRTNLLFFLSEPTVWSNIHSNCRHWLRRKQSRIDENCQNSTRWSRKRDHPTWAYCGCVLLLRLLLSKNTTHMRYILLTQLFVVLLWPQKKNLCVAQCPSNRSTVTKPCLMISVFGKQTLLKHKMYICSVRNTSSLNATDVI